MAENRAVRREHPEDRKMRLDGEEYARRRGPDFIGQRAAAMAHLVTTYADADAHDLLDCMREQFWSRGWE